MADETVETPEVTPEAQAEAEVIKELDADVAAFASQTGQQAASKQDDVTASETPAAASETKPADEGSFTPSDAQRQAAKHLGLTDAETADFDERDWKYAARESRTKRQFESQMGRLQEQIGKKPDGESKERETPLAKNEETPSGDPEAIDEFDDEETRTRKMNAILANQKKIEERLAKYEQGSAASQQQQATIAADSFFEALDAETFDGFGAGKTADLDPDGPEVLARGKLLKWADRLAAEHKADGDEATREQCLTEALAIVAGDKFKKSIEKPVREAVQKRRDTGGARPSGSQRHNDGQSSEAEVIAELDADIKASGLVT